MQETILTDVKKPKAFADSYPEDACASLNETWRRVEMTQSRERPNRSRLLLYSMQLRSTWIAASAFALLMAAAPAGAAPWTLLGDHALSGGLAGPRGASAPFVGMSADGATLVAFSQAGRPWSSADQGVSWQPLESLEAGSTFRPDREQSPPELGPRSLAVRHPYRAGRIYGLADDLHLSKDDGETWTALTNEAEQPMIGGRPSAIAFDPADPDRIFVSTEAGLWRSADGGLTWFGLNAAFPNFPTGRFHEVGAGAPPLFEAAGVGFALLPGGARRWVLARSAPVAGDEPAFASFERFLDTGEVEIAPPLEDSAPWTAQAVSGGDQPLRAVGTSDGRIWLSVDGGISWRPAGQGLPATGERVAALWVDPRAPRAAVAIFGGRAGGRVFRTVDGGQVWDDLTAGLPPGELRAVTASVDGGAVYVGGEAGVFHASISLLEPSPAADWEAVSDDLPGAAVSDLFLSARTGQLYVALEGYGVYRRRAPDVLRSMRLLNAADLSGRAIAPGGLLTLLGAAVGAATIDGLPAPVLFATDEESQIQAPFQARPGAGATVRLATSQGPRILSFPIQALAPAIFTDNGEPLVLDAGTGRLLDLSRPARPGTRILILAAGLGAVNPVWPAGLAAPVENPPAVVAPVSAWLDGVQLEVVSATLAGGYVGAYWVEAELPISLQGGSGSLVIEAGGNRSNAVRLLLAP